VIRSGNTIRSNNDLRSPAVAGAELPEYEDVIIEVDARRVINQTPTRWHIQYGIHMGWSMVTFFIVVAILGTMAFITQLGLLFWGASLAISVLFVSVMYPGWMIGGLKVTKTLPDTGIVAKPMPITYTIENTRKHFPVYSIRVVELFPAGQLVDLPRVYIPYIKPGRSCSFQILVTPSRRGQVTCLGTRLASKYPFGLLTRFRTVIDKRVVTVYPPLGNLTAHVLPANLQSDYQLGLTQPRYRGTSDEFYALREYRAGDNPRLIHWKRSARMRRLVVREMSQYSPNRMTVVLDTFLPEQNLMSGHLFELMVSFTSTLLCLSLERGYRAGLVCSGVPPLMVPPLAGREAQHRILRTLSAVEHQSHSSLVDLFQNWRLTRGWTGRCFIVSAGEPSRGLLGKLGEIIGPVQVFIVGTPEWRNAFMPPMCLRAQEVLVCHV